jgi:hypothetical protein
MMRLVHKLLAALVLFCLLHSASSAQVAVPDIPADQQSTSDAVDAPSTIIAKPELQRPSAWGEPTEVGIAIYLIDVDEVQSASQNFSASVYYEARWKVPTLQHQGPGPKIASLTRIWTPRLTILNQQQTWNAYPSYVEIYPDGEVVYRQKAWGWFSQPLDLRDFPFDQQTLSIHIVAAGLLQTDVTMIPLLGRHGRGSGIAQKFSLPDFEVKSWNAEPRAYFPYQSEVGTAGFIMEVNLERQPNFYVWKLIIPLCFIVAMSWVPRWIDPKEVGTNLGISATSFLTLVAYLFASNVLLPRVAYFTRMDLFILLSTFMVFLGLAHTVMASWLYETSSGGLVKRINFWSRAIYPLVLIGILMVSFLRYF